MIESPRLILVPASVELARAELNNRDEFVQLLDAVVPYNWPPETLVDALPLFLAWLDADPNQIGWYAWYALLKGDQVSKPMLIASIGFKGPPDRGAVEIGYSVLPQHQNLGIATEMVGSLIPWAFGHSDVEQIVAETEYENPASVRVLEKNHFVPAGISSNPAGSRFVLKRTSSILKTGS